MKAITESAVELTALEILAGLGYAVLYGRDIEPESDAAERTEFSEVVLRGRLRSALARLNPHLGADSIDDVVRKVTRISNPNLGLANHEFHNFLVNGVPVEYRAADGAVRYATARLFDFSDPAANDWLAVNQFTVIGGGKDRRPDIVLFVNGLPLAVIELKNLADEQADIESAFDQHQTYKLDIPDLYAFNSVLVVSDGTLARVGSLTAGFDRFMPWRTMDGVDVAPPGSLELEVLLRGVFAPSRLLDLIRNFVLFNIDQAEVRKVLAGYHQFHAVIKAVESTVAASAAGGSQKAGVIWHTQGSGKSLSMVFYAAKVIQRPEMENPTIIVLTDRNDLDDQLFGTFCECSEILRTVPVQAESKEHLRELLHQRASGGVIFTTLQKFGVERGLTMPRLSERRNIVFIADEAHRSQYGLSAHIDPASGEIGYGFAKHLRDDLPNASFIGFTGTPVELGDRSTKAVFGEYIDTYDIRQSVDDHATVPIFYEGRVVPVAMVEEYRGLLDQDFDTLTVSEDDEARDKLRGKWARLEAILGAPERLARVAQDLVQHFEDRQTANEGKGLVVVMSRRIAAALYDEIVSLRPAWHSEANEAGALKVVMSASSSDRLEFQQHRRSKPERKLIEKRFKDPSDPLKLVIVRDMWLTGFDVLSLHTMYIDKPMQGHGLMQAIARVNRVFGDKPGGLVVDYIGVAHKLKEALVSYSRDDQQQVGVDLDEAAAALLTKYEVVRDMLHGFDYLRFFTAGETERVRLIPQALDHLFKQPEGKQRYLQGVKELAIAFALAVPHETALKLREEVALFQAIRAAMVKASAVGGKSRAELDIGVRQILSKAISSGEIVDVFKASGLVRPDLSILSDEFLEDMHGAKYKNLAVEAMAKLLKDEISTKFRANVVRSRLFSEMLERTLKQYENRTLEIAQVLDLLIEEARQIRHAGREAQQLNLNSDEVAFYDALADNESAKQAMGDAQLATMARLLTERLRKNLTVDWSVRESARAKLRIMVRRLLAEHGYPPDLAEKATLLVLQQAEALSAHWLDA